MVRRRIEAAGGDPDAVAVLAVTKGFGPEAVRQAVAAGRDVGENYAQERLAKHAAWRVPVGQAGEPAGDSASAPPGGARWHFLGAVQRNKVRALAPIVGCWQGVARPVEGEEIARWRPGASVLVQVDTTGAPGRGGCPPGAVASLVDELGALELGVHGLMTVAPAHPDGARQAFRTVRELADRLGLAERSMGMTGDLEAAVHEGTTMVRVGRALFGERPPRHAPAAGT